MDMCRLSQQPLPFSYSTQSPATATCPTSRPPTSLLLPPILSTTSTQPLVMAGRTILMGHQVLVTMVPLMMRTLMEWLIVQPHLAAMARLTAPPQLLTIPGQLPSAKLAGAWRKTTCGRTLNYTA